jgi:hypothetical protein
MNNKLKTYQTMRKTILLSVLFALPVMANAFNGKAKVGGIWYNIVTKAEKAEVTADYPTQHYQGRVVIPKTIVYEGVTCKVTAIGEGAFAQSEVQQVVIPNSVTSIGSRAFIYCGKLNSVTIPESVETIGSYAFSGCYNLKNIKLPQDLKTIEEGLFKGCNQLQAITIPEKVTKIGPYAFNGCRDVTTVSLNEKLDSICSNAFSGCGLLSVAIPNTVRFIESEAFKECPSLKTLTIGSGVEKISHGAFEKCGDLKDVYLNGGRLPNLVNNTNPFRGSEVEYATLHVAESLIELCKQVEPWKGFGKIAVNPDAIVAKADDSQEYDETIYEPKDCNGQFPKPFMKRYELSKWLEENAKFPEEAKAKGLTSGTVPVNFVVEPDGSISNVKADEGSWPELIPEAERVVKSMPKWNAGKVNGKYARVRERIAVHFSR